MSLRARMQNSYDTFTLAEQKIADYLLQHATASIGMSIHQMAAAAEVSPASVSRFAHRLGYKSFGAMRIDMARDADINPVADFEETLRWSLKREDLTDHFIRSIAEACGGVLTLNDMSTFAQAATLIGDARAVYLFGLGASSLVAQDLQHKLLKLRKRVIYSMDGSVALQNVITAVREDVVVAISYGGNTPEVCMAARQAKENGCLVIAISRYTKTELSSLADLNLFVPNIEPVTRIATVFSRYAHSFLVDLLFLNLAQQYDSPTDVLEQYRQLLRPQGDSPGG